MYQKLMHNKSLRLIGGLLGGLLLSVAINVFVVPQGLYGGGAFVVKSTGRDLELRAMTGMELLITGRISQIQLG